MEYNPEIHHRKSIRLYGYDYTQEGLYFLTCCAQHHVHLFGEIVNDQMILNEAGNMVLLWYYTLEQKFSHIHCHEVIVMPNHVHCIIEMRHEYWQPSYSKEYSLSKIVQWFKTMTTNKYIHGVKNQSWKPFNKRLWQRDYWDHIIRTTSEYETIAQYIISNPEHWQKDKLNKERAEN